MVASNIFLFNAVNFVLLFESLLNVKLMLSLLGYALLCFC